MKRPPAIVVQLIHIRGPLKGEIQEFSDPVISVGRHSDSRVLFPADLVAVSRKHAEIVREGNQFKLIDHSANGTFVNGKQVKEALLKDGDVLEFAKGGPKLSFLTQIREDREEKDASLVHSKENVTFQSEPRGPEAQKPEAGKPKSVLPKMEAPEERIPIQPMRAPLTIQYGPTLRSFNQLPVTIGKDVKCDFRIEHPQILDQHAQIFFAQDQYWVKDLTGLNNILLNGQSVGLQAPMKMGNQISLTPQGPAFQFLGEGRLAEISPPSLEDHPSQSPIGKRESPPSPKSEGKSHAGLFSKVKKIF